MASRRRAATRRSTRSLDKAKNQVARNWRKKIRLTSPSPAPDSDSESTFSTKLNHEFQGFMNLPVDVFVNIAFYFQPQDVLALSRVNSFLRCLLRSPKSEPIWRSARLNIVGLPPCPKELSEPQYAGLLFSKMCTLCKGRAIQSMDPMLLERLCRKCKEIELVNLAEEFEEVDASLVFTSTTVLRRYSEDWLENGPWCFYNDLKVVKSTLYKFDIAEDEEGKQSWIKRRREIVKAREQSSEPLREWFRQLEIEREAGLERRRVAREAEIKTRLKALGHDERDMNFWGSNLAFSLVHNASPLTNKAWKGLLPKLLKIIKANHEKRIELQQINRAGRCSDIYDWAWEICEPKMFHLCQEGNLYYNQGPALNAITVRYQNYITYSALGCLETNLKPRIQLLLNDLENRPEVIPFLDENLSYEEFENHFDSETPKLTDLWISWVDEQEARLVSMMPDDTSAPEFDRPGSESTMTFGTNYDTNIPMAALPLNTQKLLRADAIFMRTPTEHNSTGASTCYFYPDFDGLPEIFTYSNLASEIAATFLASLGRPNASHLEMTSAGDNWECGMCPEIGALGWKNFVEHCLNEHWADEPRGVSDPNDTMLPVLSSSVSPSPGAGLEKSAAGTSGCS